MNMIIADWLYSHSTKADGDDVQVFSHAGLGLEGGGQLTRGSLVLIALLAGGDYDAVRYFPLHKGHTNVLHCIGWHPGLWGIACRSRLHVWSR